MESIKIIKEQFQAASITMLPGLLSIYRGDERSGVQSLCKRAEKQMIAFHEESARIYKMRSYERQYEAYNAICGIDEVGRGPLAGPVVAAAVILPKNCVIHGVNDSKQLSEQKRAELYEIIQKEAVAIGIGAVSPERIDEINILQATYEAMREAISKLQVIPDILLNDAVTIPEVSILQVPIIKGDAKSISIACASIIAKVTRDRWMVEYDQVFPEYGFAGNKGYGAQQHLEALRNYGPSIIHRRSFIKRFI